MHGRVLLGVIGLWAALGAACAAPTAVPSPLPPPTATRPPTAAAGPSIEKSRALLEAFFVAYNAHDLDAVLATLDSTFAYGDCDFAARQMRVFEDRAALVAWLTARFAEGDQLALEELVIAPAEGSPPNDPRSTAAQVARTLAGLAGEKRSLFKIVLNEAGDRIQYLNTYGNVDCAAGR